MFKASLLIDGQKEPDIQEVQNHITLKEKVLFSHGGDGKGESDYVTVYRFDRDEAIKVAKAWRS